MAGLCYEMAPESSNPAPFFLMQKVFSGISSYWDEEPIIVEEAKFVENELLGRINDLVEKLESGASHKEILISMNMVVSSYLFLYKRI
jgi:hypothetical protein